MSLQTRLSLLQQTIGDRSVRLVAVTKSATLAQIEEAYALGLRDFGENRVQDALIKMEALPPGLTQDVRWHLIGHLQRNKVKKTLGNFYLIHSVDSFSLAQEISRQNQAVHSVQSILLQVNIAQEPTKFGFGVEELRKVFPELLKLSHVKVCGLMTMAPAMADENTLVQVFGRLRDLRDQFVIDFHHPLPELSMGMSQDYVQAMRWGATIIRVGSNLFSQGHEG